MHVRDNTSVSVLSLFAELFGQVVGSRAEKKVMKTEPGEIGCACRLLDPAATRWRNGVLAITPTAVVFRTHRESTLLDRASLILDSSRSPSLRERLVLMEGDRIYPGLTIEGKRLELAVGHGRAAVIASLKATPGGRNS